METFTPKQIRQCLELLQQDIADECGVSKKTIARYEAGESNNKRAAAWFANARVELINSIYQAYVEGNGDKFVSYKHIRQLSGYTQEELALTCEVDRRTIARFEIGLSHNTKLSKWYDNAFNALMSEVKNETN